MSQADTRLRSIIGAARDTVRRVASIAAVFAVFAVIPAVLLFAWVLGLGTNISHRIPLALDVFAIAIATAIGTFAALKWIRRITDRAVAASAESALGFSEGELQGVLEMSESAPAGTSSSLLRHAEQGLVGKLIERPPFDLAGRIGVQTRTRRLRALATAGALCGAVIILALAAPERSRAAWAPLLRPVATIGESALPPLDVRPGNVSVARGASLNVVVGAHERDAVALFWRARGDVLHEVSLPVVQARAAGRITDVDAPVSYWVRAPDGAMSDTFTITPTDPLLVSALTIDVVYPAYLQRAAEHFDKDVPPLELPSGTQLRIHGRATRQLAAVSLQRDAEHIPLTVSGSSFSATWVPRASGTYAWQLRGAAQIDAAAAPAPLEIRVIADAAPEIEVTYPGVDTLLSADMKQLIVADARDDHAITSATIVSWRANSAGGREGTVEQALALEGEAGRKLIRGELDATARRLLPGDRLSYFVRITDNSPSRQSSVSRTYTLRVPGMEEMRDRVQQQAEDLVKDADALSRSMEQLQTRTRELQRKALGGGAQSGARGNGGEPGSEQRQLTSEQAQQAREVLDRQQAMSAELEKMRDRVQSMERAAELAGLRDPEMQKRMEELRQLYDQLLSPELKKQLQDLRAAIEKLDPEQVKKALEELAKQQAELSKKLDQSLELLRRAAAEQDMARLAQETKELSAQQQAVAEQLKANDADSNNAAAKEKELARKADALAASMKELQRKLSEQGETDASSKAGKAQDQTKDAREAMTQAARQASLKNSGKAGESGQQAADKLAAAAETLDAARKQMTDAWKKDVQASVDNATQDAISLAQMQKQLLDRMDVSKQGKQDGKQQGQQSKENGQQQGGKAGEKGEGQQKPGQQGSTGSSGQPGSSPGLMQKLRSDQSAVKQGLEQLGKNLQEAGQRSALVSKDVGAALARANLNMDETMKALEQASQDNLPKEEAEQTLDALNRLALELLKNGQKIQDSEDGTGLQEALKQLAELAKQQGNLNGRSNSLLPLNLGPKVMTQQLGALAREQHAIAQKLGGMNKGGARDDLLGRLDELAKEADDIAKALEGGRIAPEIRQRQAKLFHKLLDAGRTIERDETSEERKAEAAQTIPASIIRALRPGLFDNANKYAVPTIEQLRGLPPAYRRLVLEYFQKLNRPEAARENGAKK